MVKWQILFTKHAKKDLDLLRSANLIDKAHDIINCMKADPYYIPPPYEKLKADLNGYYSRRINIKHRLVYSVNKDKREIEIKAMFSHYGD